MKNSALGDKSARQGQSAGQIVSLLAFSLLGIGCGITIMSFVMGGSFDNSSFPVRALAFLGLFIWMYAAMVLQIILHESGHLVSGLLSGYKFGSFRIFSLMWIKDGERIRFCRLSVAGTGGQCLMSAPQSEDWRFPVTLYNLGGVIMNFVTAVAAVVAAVLIGFSTLPGAMLMIFALAGLAFAILNGIPLHTSSVDNDGYNAYALRRNPKAMRAFALQMRIAGEGARGTRLKDMPSEWFEVPSDEDMKNSMVAVMGVFACNRLMDEMRFGEADALMAHLLEIDSGIVGLHRNMMMCDRIFIELITANRRDVVDAMLNDAQKLFMKRMGKFLSVLRTQYAYALLCEKDAQKAADIKAQFDRCAKRYPYPADVESEYELIETAGYVDF